MRQASYRGARFHVSSTSENFGRRVVVHEFPLRDSPFYEDLGEKAQKISIEGYLVGDTWLSARDALISACRAGGAGTLVHPFYARSMRAHCTSLSVSETKDELGRVGVTMEFMIEHGGSGSGLFSLSFAIANVQFSVDAAISLGGVSFSAGVNFGLSGPALMTQGAIESFAVGLDEVRLLSRLDSVAESRLSLSIQGLFDGAASISRGDGTLPTRLADIVGHFRDAAEDAGDLARNLAPLRSFGLDFAPARVQSDVRRLSEQNYVQTAAYLRRSIGLLHGEFASTADYMRRSDALREQNGFSLWVQDEHGRIALRSGSEILEAFDRATARIVEVFVRKSTDLSPSIDLALPPGVTALSAATRIYKDPERAIELWRSTGSPHPAIMPRQVTIGAR